MARECCECIRVRKTGEVAAVERRAMREVGDVGERLCATCLDDALRAGFGEPCDHSQAEA